MDILKYRARNPLFLLKLYYSINRTIITLKMEESEALSLVESLNIKSESQALFTSSNPQQLRKKKAI